MNVTYDGPHEAVTVLALGRQVKRGEAIDVPDDLGAQLVDQGWTPAPDPEPTPKPAKAAKKENV